MLHLLLSPLKRVILGALHFFRPHLPHEDKGPFEQPTSRTGKELVRLADAIRQGAIRQDEWQALLKTLRMQKFKPRPDVLLKDIDLGIAAIIRALKAKRWAPMTIDDEDNLTYYGLPLLIGSFLEKAQRSKRPVNASR